MYYHAFTIEHSVEKPVEELGDAVMSPLFHRVSAVCPVLHIFGVVHIPDEASLRASTAAADGAHALTSPPASAIKATLETSPLPRTRPSPGPRPPLPHANGSDTAPHPVSLTRSLIRNTAPATAAMSVGDTVFVQRHACLHVHGVYPYFYVPQYHANISATQFGAQLESVALHHVFGRGDTRQEARPSYGEDDATTERHANAPLPQAPSHRQLLHDVELVQRVPFYGFHRHQHAFFKVSVIDPAHVFPLVELLRDTTLVGQRTWQPYEAHHSFHPQFMVDYDISGMAPLRLRHCTLRCPVPEELASLVVDSCVREGAEGNHTLTDDSLAAMLRARRLALDVRAVSLPDERERVTSADVELDVRGVDLLETQDGAAPETARTGDNAEKAPAKIGAHLAHVRRSLKHYFFHHGVPDKLRTVNTMEAEARVEAALREGRVVADASPTTSAAANGLDTMRYGTVEQLQRNDPAACVMRARMAEYIATGARQGDGHALQAKVEAKPEKLSFWQAMQLQKMQPQHKVPWLVKPPDASSWTHAAAAGGQPCPWAELDPLGPPCETLTTSEDALAEPSASADAVAVAAAQSTSQLTQQRLSSDEAVPLTFELLDALARPLPNKTVPKPEVEEEKEEEEAAVNGEPLLLSSNESSLDGDEKRKDGDEQEEGCVATSVKSPRWQVGDTVAFVVRTTSHHKTTILLRVVAACRLCALSSATSQATVQWLIALPETHFAAEARPLARRHAWLPPESVPRGTTHKDKHSTHDDSTVHALALAAGEWMLTEDVVVKDHIPLSVLHHATRIDSLESPSPQKDLTGSTMDSAGAGRVELIACPLRVFREAAAYQRALDTSAPPLTCVQSVAPDPAITVVMLCRYEYSFRSHLLRPLDVSHASLYTSTESAMMMPSTTPEPAFGRALTQRGTFLMLPESHATASLLAQPPLATPGAGSPRSTERLSQTSLFSSGSRSASASSSSSSSSSSPSSLSASALLSAPDGDTEEKVRYACPAVRTSEALYALLSHMPFHRSVQREKDQGEVALTQGRLLHRFSSAVLDTTAVARDSPDSTPPAPWHLRKRSREHLTELRQRPARSTIQFCLTPENADEEPLLPFDDSPQRPHAPPPVHKIVSEVEVMSGESVADTDNKDEVVVVVDVDDDVTNTQHVVGPQGSVAGTRPGPVKSPRAEVVLSHSTSPLSVDVIETQRETPSADDSHHVCRWLPLATTTPSCPVVMCGVVPCAAEAAALPHPFLRARTAPAADSVQTVSAATWPVTEATRRPSVLPSTSSGEAGIAPASLPKKTVPPPPQPSLPAHASASTTRRSVTTLSSHHFLSCDLRVLHVEVLLDRREATQQVAGDPLLAVVLGQASSGSESIAACVFCVAPRAAGPTPASHSLPSVSLSDGDAHGTLLNTAAPFSASPLPPGLPPSLRGRTWCLTDHVNVVELPTERALLLRVQHEMAGYDPDIIVSWEGFKYGLGLLSLRYRAVLARSLARDLSRLRPVRSVMSEVSRRDGRGRDSSDGVDPVLPRAPFRAPKPDVSADVDDDDADEVALAVAAYNLDLEGEETTDVQTAIARRYARKFGTTVRITGRVVSSVSKDIRKTSKLASHTLAHAHAVLTGQSLPYFSDTTLANLYHFPSTAHAGPDDVGHCVSGHRLMALRYLVGTVMGVRRVTTQLHYHTQAVEFSRLYGVLYEEAITRGSQFKVEATLCRIARPQGYVLLSPSMGATHRQPRIQRIPLILQPKSDFYKDPVIVLDFRSLYPSVVIAYNLCYSTCLGLVQPSARGRLGVLPQYQQDTALVSELLTPGSVKVEADEDPAPRFPRQGEHTAASSSSSCSQSGSATDPLGVIVSPNGAMFVPPFVREGVLPRMLQAVLDTRIEVQAADKCIAQSLHDPLMHSRLQEQQFALKMLANTTYGYTAASFTGRMPCVDVAEAIVAFGRQALERAIALVHERTEWGAEVVYGDTDSLFVHLPGRTRAEAFAIGEAIAKAVTASNPAPITLQFEKVIQPCLLLVKKRYAGYAWFNKDQTAPSFLAKGIETVRRDQCSMTSRLVATLLRALFDGASPTALHKLYMDEAIKVRSGVTNPSEFIFRRAVKLGRYQDERHLPLAAHLALKQMQRDLLQTPFWGERLPYVVCRSLLSTKLKDQVVPPQELIASSNRLTVDTEYYMRAHANAALDRMFYLVGVSFSRWYAEMSRRRQWASYMDVEAFLHLQAQRNTRPNDDAVVDDDAENDLLRRDGRANTLNLNLSGTHDEEYENDNDDDDDDGGAPDRPVDVERTVGHSPLMPSPITVNELTLSANDDDTLMRASVVDLVDDDDDDEDHDSDGDKDNSSPFLRPPPLATQRVDGMRTLDRYYPRARCVVCERNSVTLEAHQQQLSAALQRRRVSSTSRGRAVSLRAVPPICAACWGDPLTLLAHVQTRYRAVAQRLRALEDACQVCMGSLGSLGGHGYLHTLGDVEELPTGWQRPASSAVPRSLTQPVAFLTVAEAKAAAKRMATKGAPWSAEQDAQVAQATFGCTSIDCDISFEKRNLLLQRTQLQALSWYLHDAL